MIASVVKEEILGSLKGQLIAALAELCEGT
jgi:hypothetical protein